MARGDALAAGAKSAIFPASDGKVSQERWDEAFKDIGDPRSDTPQEKSDVRGTTEG